MPESVLNASQELDKAQNQLERGEINKDEFEARRQVFYKELQAWKDSNDDRMYW